MYVGVCLTRLYWLPFVLLLTAHYTSQENQLYLEYIIVVSVYPLTNAIFGCLELRNYEQLPRLAVQLITVEDNTYLCEIALVNTTNITYGATLQCYCAVGDYASVSL